MNKYDEAMKLMSERYSKDVGLSLATIGRFPSENGARPAVRNVSGFYEDGAFYVVTYSKSNKMQQIANNPEVAIDACFEWFSANGIGEDLGWVRDEKNAAIMEKVRTAFAEWYNNGHVNEDDQNTCLLRINLTSGVLFKSPGDFNTRYEIDFTSKTVK